MRVHPFPQYLTRPLVRIYHTLGAKIECFLVDYSCAPASLREYDEKINASKIGNYNAVYPSCKAIRNDVRKA
jgi:hypothetical protein